MGFDVIGIGVVVGCNGWILMVGMYDLVIKWILNCVEVILFLGFVMM